MHTTKVTTVVAIHKYHHYHVISFAIHTVRTYIKFALKLRRRPRFPESEFIKEQMDSKYTKILRVSSNYKGMSYSNSSPVRSYAVPDEKAFLHSEGL